MLQQMIKYNGVIFMSFMDYFPKLILASIIGIIIGYERGNRRNIQIGTGTTSILVLGATLLTIISKYCLGGGDVSRLIANIITAVGFLCGSVIFLKHSDDDPEVVGLTTGATLFTLTGVGIAIGLGYYELAITSTLLIEFNIFVILFYKF